MIEVVFRASDNIEDVSAQMIHDFLQDELGLHLIESPAGYVVHVHNLDDIEDYPEDYDQCPHLGLKPGLPTISYEE